MKSAVYQIVWTTLLLSVTLISCQLDDDQEFFPKTRKAFFLLSDPENGTKTILGYRDAGLTTDLQLEWGVMGDQLADMAGQYQNLWLAVTEQNKILKIDPNTEGITQTYSTGSLNPHFLSIGNDHLLISDTISKMIGFIEKDSKKIITREVDSPPGQSVYKAGKFFIELSGVGIVIYNETAYAETGRLELKNPILDLQIDPAQRIYVYSGFPLQESAIDINSDNWVYVEREINALKKRWNTIRTPLYEKEWVEPVIISYPDSILTPGLYPASDFEMDFFESRAFYIRQDSLFSVEIPVGSPLFLGPVNGKLENAYFFQD